jgi:transcriptional antiterminator Rof (Rho-off)
MGHVYIDLVCKTYIYIYIFCVNGLYEVLSIDDGNKVQNPSTML